MSSLDNSSTRRDVVLTLAAVAVAPGLFVACRRAADPEALAAALASRLRRLDAVRAVGRAVVGEHAGESDPRQLAQQLAADLEWRPSLAGEELDRRLGERIRDDFRHGRILTVDSWRLSATEARVAALVSLLAD